MGTPAKPAAANSRMRPLRSRVPEPTRPAALHEPVIVELRKVLPRLWIERIGHREDEHTVGLQQPASVDERTGHGRRNVLENLAGYDEIIVAREAGGHRGDVESGLAVE